MNTIDLSDPVTLALLYIFLGCVVWAFVFGTESWAIAIDSRAVLAVVIASLTLIVLWLPVLVFLAIICGYGTNKAGRVKRRAF